ncbi:MAG TPA: hypothetical protein VNG94_04730, partial [Pyrinomonadaceae bacterium]|nr:hypothetical protein [Pyrinomonadaceae bacterium]
MISNFFDCRALIVAAINSFWFCESDPGVSQLKTTRKMRVPPQNKSDRRGIHHSHLVEKMLIFGANCTD